MKHQFVIRIAVFSAVAVGLSGCAAAQMGLSHKNLNVQTKMSNTIFLPPTSPSRQTVYVQFKNTADQSLDVPALTQELDARMESQGYRVVPYKQAHYLLQINVLSVGKMAPSAARNSLTGGYGGALAGAAAGGLIGGSYLGAGVGGLVGGIGGLVADSLVKNVTYGMITDVQVGVRSRHAVQQQTNANLQQGTSTSTTQNTSQVGHWMDYRTRIVSTANQVNLSFKTALPVLQGQLVHSLGGIL
ncbi:TraT complement resistance protein [Acidithiobacillus ferrivorans]|uniref:TraT complement resistance protein n=1 Tax=Acidithiobacillus ferrivorans TaxID=160808 RepID=A0A060UVH5_9PROT|nr:complement resistance protein TraT [Acidithiobacillus ferrivorans]CDQ10539.1 TraT complement resistance protein [Acidithiobacillus ferrivorans]SMH64569.1 TraT complement resistance protein [Acidithiobacillus ferrivorans]